MSELLIFLYAYYRFYFYLTASLAGTFITYIYCKRRKSDVGESVFVSSVRLFGFIVCDIVLALVVRHHIDNLVMQTTKERVIEILIKCLMIALAGCLVVPLASLAYKLLCKTKKYVDDNNLMGLLTFVYLFINLLIYPTYEVDDWVSAWYVTDYSMGIGSRFFMGTLFRLVCGDFVPASVVRAFFRLCCFIIICLVSLFANHIYKNSVHKLRFAFSYLWVLFLANPGSVVCLWIGNCFGKLEVYGFLLSLICILIYHKLGMKFITFVIITVMSVISIAIYQGYIFMYYPIIAMIFLWEMAVNSKRVQAWIYGLGNLMITCCAFLFFQFCSYTNFSSASEMADTLSKMTDLPISEKAIDLELFQPLSEAFAYLNKGFIESRLPRERAFFTMLLISPVIIIFIGLYGKCLRLAKKENKNTLHSIYFYFVALLLFIIPQFMFNVDWGRWMISESIVLFSGFFFLIWKKDKNALKALESFGSWILKHNVIGIVSLVFVCGLARIETFSYIKQVTDIVEWHLLSGWFLIE